MAKQLNQTTRAEDATGNGDSRQEFAHGEISP
jgi:hypothetical protein